MATGTAPVIPTSGAAAATTKNTIPATPSRFAASSSPEVRRCPVVATGPGVGSAVGSVTVRLRRAVPRGRRHVQGGVAVEEAHRLEHEAGAVDGHDRPVLRARHVGEPEGVPEDDVLAVQVAVGGGVGGQPGPAGVLVDEVARGVA